MRLIGGTWAARLPCSECALDLSQCPVRLTRSRASGPELRKAASEFEQLFGPDYVNLGTINKELSQNLYSLGQVDEAQTALRSAIQIYDKHAEQRATGLPAARISLSVLLQAVGERQGAAEQLDLAMQDRLQSSEKGMPTVEQIRGMRAVLLVSQGSLQQGINELIELQAGTPQNLHLAHLAFCDALARAYVEVGNLEAASGRDCPWQANSRRTWSDRLQDVCFGRCVSASRSSER